MNIQVVKDKVTRKKWLGFREEVIDQYAILIDGEHHAFYDTEQEAQNRAETLKPELEKREKEYREFEALLKERGIEIEDDYVLINWYLRKDYAKIQIDGWFKIKR